jgi:hypothetical protein
MDMIAEPLSANPNDLLTEELFFAISPVLQLNIVFKNLKSICQYRHHLLLKVPMNI